MTVNEIQSYIAATTDQNENTSDISASDYSHRLNLINKRERTWAEVTDWRVLYTEYNTRASSASANVTVTLPGDFRKPAGYPNVVYDGTNTKQFSEVEKQRWGQYATTDKLVAYIGTPGNGAYAYFQPGTSNGYFASGASIMIPYYKSPASLATSSHQVTCPNPMYLVKSVIADIWESKEDQRYTTARAEAEQILANMLERETMPSEADADRSVKTVEQSRYGMRWGE